MKASSASQDPAAAERISQKIAGLADWRGEALGRMRKLIQEADPDVVEEWKWVKATNPGTPVWSHDGIICTGESYREVVKLTFAKGASVKDPKRLFNSSLEGNLRRAIDIREGETVDASAFKALIRAAVELNLEGKSKPKPKRATSPAKPARTSSAAKPRRAGSTAKPRRAGVTAKPRRAGSTAKPARTSSTAKPRRAKSKAAD